MKNFIEKNRKAIFYLIIVLTYICIVTYIFLTPYLSDDYAYMMELRDDGTGHFSDVFRLAYAEYFQHGGRLLHYVTFRFFFYMPTKHIYDFVAGIYFVLLGLLIYFNIEKKQKYDIGILLLSYLGLWIFSIRPGQTIVWISGGVGYLFATVYVLGSITYYRYLVAKYDTSKPILTAVLMFVLALLAGNSSENNSAAAILIFAIVTLTKYFDLKKKTQDNKLKISAFVKPYMIAAFIGYIIGYGTLVLSPGAWNRVESVSDGSYEGVVGILSHVYKITIALDELFLPFFIIIGVLLTVLVVNRRFKCFKDIIENPAVIFIIAAFAGSYVLAVIDIPEYRVFFGVSVFLMISVIQLLQQICDGKFLADYGVTIKFSLIVGLCIVFSFTYLENLVNLSRINREKSEQVSIIEEAVNSGNTEYVEIPQLHAPFDNKYTIAYYPQLSEDPAFWLNTYYEGWFGVDRISAVPRDVWDENH